jgi:hypothetical protein
MFSPLPLLRRVRSLATASVPGKPANLVDVFYKNEGEMDFRVVEFVNIQTASNYPSDLDRQREKRDEMSDGILRGLSKASQAQIKHYGFELAGRLKLL